MAVEAHRILSNRELMMNGVQGIGNACATPAGYGAVPPLSATAAATENVLPLCGAAAAKSESGVTYAIPGSRKRSRDWLDYQGSPLLGDVRNQTESKHGGSFNFLGEDFSFHLLQQQLEIDRFIAQQTERLRMEIEERRKRFSQRIAVVVQEQAVKKLKAKEEEMDNIGKRNFALEERVKSLYVENQILKELAQTNEATANALRCNLEQVLLAQVQDEQQLQQQHHLHPDNVESCCNSNFDETNGRSSAEDNKDHDYKNNINSRCIDRNRICRSCSEQESSVLLLPCRHLCVCTMCVSALHACPVCNLAKTASLHVNLSESAS